jgi:hypothetical protein
VKLLRAVLGRLDPWAAVLLGILPALGVVILLSTPGPWEKVVGEPAPVKISAPPPTNVAVFVMGGGTTKATCSAVLWLHMDHVQPALTAVAVNPDTLGFVSRGGFAPLRRVVDEAGPGAAASALGRALGVHIDAWVALDKDALRRTLTAMFPTSDVRAPLLGYKHVRAAWRGRGSARQSWTQQYRTLQVGLPRVCCENLNIVTFSNYVLGFGHVRSNLNLQGSTSLATSLHDLLPSHVTVTAVGAVAERSRHGVAWHIDSGSAQRLRLALEQGTTVPVSKPTVRRATRAARVLVVLPGQWRGWHD